MLMDNAAYAYKRYVAWIMFDGPLLSRKRAKVLKSMVEVRWVREGKRALKIEHQVIHTAIANRNNC